MTALPSPVESGPEPRAPGSCRRSAVGPLVRGAVHALTLVMVLALVAWPEDHHSHFVGWTGSRQFGSGVDELIDVERPERIRIELMIQSDGQLRAYVRDDSFSVLARRFESIFGRGSQ